MRAESLETPPGNTPRLHQRGSLAGLLAKGKKARDPRVCVARAVLEIGSTSAEPALRTSAKLPATWPWRPLGSGISRAGEHQAWLGLVGVPHLIVLVDDVDRLDVAERGRQLRFNPALGAEGANVNFISPPTGPGKPWLIRTYERGVEGETLACGTGTVAAALLLVQVGRTRLPLVFASRSGSQLSVRATPTTEGGFRDVWLQGEGRSVFEGVLA